MFRQIMFTRGCQVARMHQHVRSPLLNSTINTVLRAIPEQKPDPIFAAQTEYAKSTHPNKINGTIGIYKSSDGPVLPTVDHVLTDEKFQYELRESMAGYLPIRGDPAFIDAMECTFLAGIPKSDLISFQTLSGTGGLYLAKGILTNIFDTAPIMIPSSSWANHSNVFGANSVNNYIYENGSANLYGGPINIGKIATDILNCVDYYRRTLLVPVLMHTCAHNPSGVDLNSGQWRSLLGEFAGKPVLPVFDTAYAGFASGNLETDLEPLRIAAELKMPFISVFSCSKNFGLYNARVGMLTAHVPGVSESDRNKIVSSVSQLIRRQYSNPPAFGALVVRHILSDPELCRLWCRDMKIIANDLRGKRSLISAANGTANFQYIKDGVGMFSLLNLNDPQLEALKKEGIYTVGRRISLCGIKHEQLNYLRKTLHKITTS